MSFSIGSFLKTSNLPTLHLVISQGGEDLSSGMTGNDTHFPSVRAKDFWLIQEMPHLNFDKLNPEFNSNVYSFLRNNKTESKGSYSFYLYLSGHLQYGSQ